MNKNSVIKIIQREESKQEFKQNNFVEGNIDKEKLKFWHEDSDFDEDDIRQQSVE